MYLVCQGEILLLNETPGVIIVSKGKRSICCISTGRIESKQQPTALQRVKVMRCLKEMADRRIR